MHGAREETGLTKHRVECPKLQQQFADLKRGLAVVTESGQENTPRSMTRREERGGTGALRVPDSIIVSDW